MKLVIVWSLIACSYAAKLDRTYLPPASAATAGGSPGSLTAPFGASGPASPNNRDSGFSQAQPGFRQSAAGPGFEQSTRPSSAGKPIGPVLGSSRPSGFGQPSGPAQSFGSGFSQTSSAGFGQPTRPAAYGQPSGSAQPAKDSGFGQPSLGGFNQSPTPSSQYGQPSGPSQQTGPSRLGPQSTAGFGKPNGPSTQFGQTSGTATGLIPSETERGFEGLTSGFQQTPAFRQSGQDTNFSGQQYNQPERSQAAADRNAEILRYDSQNDGETFFYSFETSNGISAEESGVATNGVQAQGAFSYTGDDGELYRVTYTADENGYRPQGDHLPTPPPIPDEILRSIEENARAAAAGTQEGAYRPEEYETGESPQQYSGTPGSFNQATAIGQGNGATLNQGQGPLGNIQQYGSSDVSSPGPSRTNGAGISGTYGQSRPNQYNQGPRNQFPSAPSAFNQGQLAGPSDQPKGSAQSPSQQYGSSNAAYSGASGSAGLSGPSKPFNQIPAGKYNQGSRNQNTVGERQRFGGQGSQVQGDNGYEYNRPQSSFGINQGRPSQTTPPQSLGSQQYSQPETQQPSGSQYNRPGQDSSFSRPSASQPSKQSTFSKPGSSRPGQGSFGINSGSNQDTFGPTTGPAAALASQTLAPGSRTPVGKPGQTSGLTGNQGSFGNGQNAFGSQSGTGSLQANQYKPGRNMMPASAPYQYDRPGANQSQKQESSFEPTAPTFGGPRAPPSFSAEKGYVY